MSAILLGLMAQCPPHQSCLSPETLHLRSPSSTIALPSISDFHVWREELHSNDSTLFHYLSKTVFGLWIDAGDDDRFLLSAVTCWHLPVPTVQLLLKPTNATAKIGWFYLCLWLYLAPIDRRLCPFL